MTIAAISVLVFKLDIFCILFRTEINTNVHVLRCTKNVETIIVR